MVSTLVATVLGTLLAIGMDRFPWGKKTNTFLDVVLHIPVVIPDIILAASLVVAFGLLRLVSGGMPGLAAVGLRAPRRCSFLHGRETPHEARTPLAERSAVPCISSFAVMHGALSRTCP